MLDGALKSELNRKIKQLTQEKEVLEVKNKKKKSEEVKEQIDSINFKIKYFEEQLRFL